MNNAFLAANLSAIEKLKTHLLELEMMGSYQEFPIAHIRHLFDGLVLEVSKLQGQIEEIVKLIPKEEKKVDSKENKSEASGK